MRGSAAKAKALGEASGRACWGSMVSGGQVQGRLSVGIEDEADLVAEIKAALAAVPE